MEFKNLTQELMNLMKNNASLIKGMLDDDTIEIADCECHRPRVTTKTSCCCPNKINFIILFSKVYIINDNAECPNSCSAG
ncbi:MAG: hypothetical protein GX968_00020 [Tissierellia bacterium]|nr:hypothetical protein [Tissierellia bacterium]